MNNESTLVDKPTEEAGTREPTRSGQYYRPNVDIVEQTDELLVYADMPGLRSEDIDIDFEDGTLTIHGKVQPRQADDTRFVRREYGVGDFFRSFRVSEHIDVQKIVAKYADGVLTLHLPKTEAVKPRKIAVQVK